MSQLTEQEHDNTNGAHQNGSAVLQQTD